MAEINYTNQYADDFMVVELVTKQDEIIKRVDALADFPCMGSPNISGYIASTYGPHVRKLVIDPVDVIYEYDEDADVVNILGLIPQTLAH